jgi:hypothetical protein
MGGDAFHLSPMSGFSISWIAQDHAVPIECMDISSGSGTPMHGLRLEYGRLTRIRLPKFEQILRFLKSKPDGVRVAMVLHVLPVVGIPWFVALFLGCGKPQLDEV